MARKEIGSMFDRNNRNAMNDNFKELYDGFNSVSLSWKEPVASRYYLPTKAEVGETRMTRDTGQVYRFDGKQWLEIQEINVSPLNEIEHRLKSELELINSELSEVASQEELDRERKRINNLVANAGNTDGNAELLDIRVGFDGVTYETAGDAVRSIGVYFTNDNEIWEVN